MKGKKRSLAHHTSLLDSVKLSLGTRASLPVLLDVGDDNSDDRPTVVCHAVLFVNFSFPWSKYFVWDHLPHFIITFVGKSISTLLI